METIIKNSIPAVKFESVERYFANCIEESIEALDECDFSGLEWYSDCSLDDYFTELEPLYTDNGEYIGDGFNMIFGKVVLNDDTRDDLEKAFENARECVYNSAMINFSERVWKEVKDYTPYPAGTECATNFQKWCECGEMNSRFDDDVQGIHIYKIYDNQLQKNVINVIFEDEKIYRY